jgi:hypothetical protein
VNDLCIGLDFDNTIVCYDEVFYKEAIKRDLISPDGVASKEKIKETLCLEGKEDQWTELQGYVYGKCMNGARLFPGFSDFLLCARKNRAQCFIISHKTKVPYKGPAFDLHRSALDWLQVNGFFSTYGFSPGEIHFLESKQLKLQCIAAMKCTWFIDDLPEFLSEKDFPPQTTPILFSPEGAPRKGLSIALHSFRTWNEIKAYVFGQK